MKKFIALALTLAMALCVLAIPTFAEEKMTDLGSQEKPVNVAIAENGDVQTVYDIDVVWGSFDFTYTFDGDAAVWNPENHAYEAAAGEDAAGSWNATSATITVTNHSNAALSATATTQDAANTNGVTFGTTNNKIQIANAEGFTKANAPSGVITYNISGTPTTKTNFQVSTITLTIAEAQ